MRERYRLKQGGVPVAWAEGPTALAEIMHYALVYGCDAPVSVERHAKGKWKALATGSGTAEIRVSNVTFHAGRPLAPINTPELEREIVRRVTAFSAERGSGPVSDHWLRVGIRQGWLSGWHAGFSAASADRSPEGQDPEEGLDAEHESAVRDSADAQTHSPREQEG